MSTTMLAAKTKTKLSPRSWGRIAGVCESLEGVTATYGQVIVLGHLLVFESAAITAANVLTHRRLFWVGFASSVIGTFFHLAWALLFYELFQPVSRRIARLAAFVILVGCAIQALTCVLYVAPLAVLRSPQSLSAFTAEQLQALALALFKINGQAFDTYLIFFGLWCILNGYLIFKSTFMPKVLGILLAISGLGWATFLCPPFAHHVFRYVAIASALGEIPLQLWLLIMGVNSERWEAQAALAAAI